MDQIPPKMLHFSTDDYPEHKRLEAYREIYGRTITKHDIEPLGEEPFQSKANLCGLPGLGLASSLTAACRRSHGPQHIDSDDLLFGVSLAGGCIVSQWGREAEMGEGEAVLLTSAEPAVVTIPSIVRHVGLRIPNSVLRSRITDLDTWLSRRIPRNTESKLLTGYVGAIWNAEALTKPDLRDAVVTHVHDLVCLLLGAKGDARELAEQRGARAARCSAVLLAIESRSGDHALSAIAVAALLAITPRYVHLLLEETGKSFTRHVLEKRLEKAAVLLRDPRWRRRKIADIATEAGFTDLSYFNRTFRRHYGATPSDIREAERRSE
jgi:AraC-like DNA-binding protein